MFDHEMSLFPRMPPGLTWALTLTLACSLGYANEIDLPQRRCMGLSQQKEFE
jgi:hypothetical protein